MGCIVLYQACYFITELSELCGFEVKDAIDCKKETGDIVWLKIYIDGKVRFDLCKIHCTAHKSKFS